MLLRKLVAALCPLVLCALCCAAFRLLDGWLGAGSFLCFALKGVLLGAALSLTLPLAGISAHVTGLTGWLLLGAGLLLCALVYQYLDNAGILSVPVLRALLKANGQVVLIEGAAMGHLTATAFLYRRA